MRKDQVFLLACLGYIGGVFVGSFFGAVWWIFFVSLACILAFMMAFPRKDHFFFLFPVALCAVGIFFTESALHHFRQDDLREMEVSGIARVINDPEEKDFYRHTLVRMESCDSVSCPHEKILWQAPLTRDIVSGARILFACTLTVPENFDPAFDYRMFLAKDNIGYICRKASRAESMDADRRAQLTKWFFIPKRTLESAIEKSLPQPEAGLAEGLILGGDSRLSKALKAAFVKAGLSHIVAISGYNIALIAQGFVICGIALGLWRRQALWLAAFGIILFIVFVGAPASAVRAGIMGIAVFAALFFGRLAQSVNMLLLAAVSMLILQPLLLRYDIGFQLSFLATLAIITMLPFLESLIPKEFLGKSLLEIALLTFAVELFVVPLLVYQFHTLSPFALLANVLLLPLVPYAMALTFLSGIVFLLLPGVHLIPAAFAYLPLRIITLSAESISAWPGAVVEASMSASMLLVWYAGLFFVIVRMKKYVQQQYVQTANIS